MAKAAMIPRLVREPEAPPSGTQKALLGEILVRDAGLDPAKLEEALGVQREKGGYVGEILVRLKAVSEEQVLRALSLQFDLPYVDRIVSREVDADLATRIPINFAKKNSLLPLRRDEGGAVVVALGNPLSTAALDDARLLLKSPLKPVLASPKLILEQINLVYDRRGEKAEEMIDELAEDDLGEIAEELKEPEDLLDVSDEAPIIRLVNSLLFQAVKERASDIHIEPMEKDVAVRFRIDGVLYEIIRPPKRFQPSIVSRIKVMGNLNIAEKRLPQDGRIRLKIAGKDIDIRLSTVPTSHGERVVMRLLDRASVLRGLEEIGLGGAKLDLIHRLIRRTSGILLVTGPTGSGKTTTLYAALSKLNSTDKNIITIEDPIEYELKGVGQIQVNPKIDLTFANGLRSILRQDPDVIMVGEIRDVETAEIAIHASLTGHLVLSTLHTNDAPGAITRLIDMGIEPFLVTSSVVAIVAQRLVRVLCAECRERYVPGDEELREAGIPRKSLPDGKLFRSRGCPVCMGTGFRGRTGIHEILVVDEAVRTLVSKSSDSATIKKIGMEHGMQTLRTDGANKVLRGETTMEEVLRVTQEDVPIL